MTLSALLDSGLSEQRIAEELERHTVVLAVFVADMSGFSALTEAGGIVAALIAIRKFQVIAESQIDTHGGRVIKCVADDVFAAFPDVESAVACGHDLTSLTPCSVGIGYGPVILLDGDLWGSEVNAASRLGEDVAGHGEVMLTDKARAVSS